MRNFDDRVFNVSFSSVVEVGGLGVTLFEYSDEAVSHFSVGKGKVEIKKSKDLFEVNLFNAGFQTRESFDALYDYFSGLSMILASKIQQLSPVLRYRNSY